MFFDLDWLLWVPLCVFAIPLAIVVIMTPVIFIAALVEKRQAQPYGPALELGQGQVKIGPYLEEMIEEAAALGFGAPSIHKHKKYEIWCAFWFNAEHDILLRSGQGKIAGMPAKQTALLTRTSEGRLLVTTDEFDEGDPTGMTDFKRVVNADLEELLDAHEERLDKCPAPIETFKEASAEQAVLAVLRQQADELIHRGRARWVDEIDGVWKYNVAGATTICFGFFKQMLLGMTQFWRVHKRRPGA
jgi:hypothetical protein